MDAELTTVPDERLPPHLRITEAGQQHLLGDFSEFTRAPTRI